MAKGSRLARIDQGWPGLIKVDQTDMTKVDQTDMTKVDQTGSDRCQTGSDRCQTGSIRLGQSNNVNRSCMPSES